MARRSCGRSVTLFREFRYEQPDPDRFYTALAADSVGQLAQYVDLAGADAPRRGRRAGLLPRRVRGRRRDVLGAGRRRRRAVRARARSPPGTVMGSGMQLPFRTARSTSATPPTSSSTCPIRGGWRTRCSGSPGPAASSSSQLHRLVRTVGRPRDRALALPRRGARPAPVPAPARPRAEEQVRRVTVPGHRARRAARGRGCQQAADVLDVAAALQPAVGALAARASPLLREVVTWNLVIVLREAVRPARSCAARCPAAAPPCAAAAATVGCWPCVAVTRAAGRGHQVRPGRRPGRLPGAARCTCGTRMARLRPAAEPGLRLPLPDGPVLPARPRCAHVPGWVVQRLWWALLLCLAFLGIVLLARALGVALRPRARARAASRTRCRRGCHHAGPDLGRGWPMPLAPWVLLPLVVGLARGLGAPCGGAVRAGGRAASAVSTPRPRSRCSRSGCCGCSPATRGPRRRALMVWWPLFTVLATLWWLVPLLLLGRYSPPFLDYIESASNTTFPTTLFDALRGTSDWVPYVDPRLARRQRPDHGRPTWRSTAASCCSSGSSASSIAATRTGCSSAWACCSGLLMVTCRSSRERAGLGRGRRAGPARRRRWRRCETCTSSTRSSACRWCWGSAGSSTSRTPALRTQGRRPRPRRSVARPATASRGDRRHRGAGGAGDVLARPHRAAHTGRRTGGGPGLLEADRRLAGGAIGPGSGPAGAGLLVRRIRLGVAARRADAVHRAQPLEHPQRRATGPRRQHQDARRDRVTAGAGERSSRAGGVPAARRGGLPGGPQRPGPAAGHPRPGARAPGPGRVAGTSRGSRPSAPGRRRRALPGGASRILVNGGWQSPQPGGRDLRGARRPASAVQPSARARSSVGPRTCWTSPTSGCWDDEPTRLAVDVRRPPRPATPWSSPTGSAPSNATSAACTTARRRPSSPGKPPAGQPARDYLLPDADRWSTWAVQEGAAVSALSSASDATAVGTTQPGQLPYAAVDGRADTFWRANFRTDEPAWCSSDWIVPADCVASG